MTVAIIQTARSVAICADLQPYVRDALTRTETIDLEAAGPVIVARPG
jgi:hypothetical protein